MSNLTKRIQRRRMMAIVYPLFILFGVALAAELYLLAGLVRIIAGGAS